MFTLVIKYHNFADNNTGLKTKLLSGDSFGELMAELSAWLMQPAYVVGDKPEHRVISLGWKGEGQIVISETNSDNVIHQLKSLLLEKYDASAESKAKKYDRIRKKNSAAGKISSANMTAEQRRERAKKAVAARIEKSRKKA